MNQRVYFPAFLLLVFLLSACASIIEREPEPVDRDVVVERVEEEEITREQAEEIFDPASLQPYEIAALRSSDFSDVSTVEIDRYSKATVFVTILDSLDLLDAFDSDQRRKFYDTLFTSVPASSSGTYKAVAVGEYFSSGEPLYLLLGVADRVRSNGHSDRVLLIQTSVLGNNEGIATRAYGRFVDMTVNLSWLYSVDPDGRLSDADAMTTPLIGERSLEQGLPHEIIAEEEARVQQELEELLEAEGIEDISELDVDPEDVLPEAEPVELPPIIDLNDPMSAQAEAALAAGAEISSLPESPAQRIRLANRLLDILPAERMSTVTDLVDPVISDVSLEETLRLEAGFTRVLYDLWSGERQSAGQRALELEQYLHTGELVAEQTVNRIQTLLPLILEAYDYH